MASNKVLSSAALFLSLNLLFFSMVSSQTPPPAPAACPIDALKLGVCANLLGGLVNVTVGSPPTLPCCSLLQGLADLEVAVCLCIAIRADVLGINVNADHALNLVVNNCGRQVPSGFQCR